MNMAIIGAGYVGLCTAVGFASKGHNVICVDIDKEKVEKINSGIAPIYEQGLDELLAKAVKNGMLKAVQNLSGIGDQDFVFISVGTPQNQDGSINLKYIENAAEDIGRFLQNSAYCVVVVKSTVLPETTDKVIIPILEKTSGKKVSEDFGICVNPEFFREGKALEDFFRPDRIIIGHHDKKSYSKLAELYSDFKAPIISNNTKTAELMKYTSNAFLATKISFINEVGNMCKKLGIDVYEVAEGMGLDKRIGQHFLQAGIGFGGSCFRKDVEALKTKARELGESMNILDSTLKVNEKQPSRIVSLLKEKIDIRNKTIAVLGLAFKEDTDDIRDAPSLQIIEELLMHNCILKCYDPKAMSNVEKIFPQINYSQSLSDALKDADACLVLTGWDEFKKLSDKDFEFMRNKIIIEGRKVLDKNKASDFEGVCW